MKHPDTDAENDHLTRIADQMNNITEKDYWDNFWIHLSLPCRVKENFSNDHIISEFLKQYVPSGENRKIALEIGCAPGKWMIFLNDELHYSAEGCEYLESAVKITRQNLEMNNIHNAIIYQGDFLSYDFGKNQYDVVISLGFIEHFTNPEFIVCDEPVSNLDVTIQLQILNLLKDIQKKFNMTYLFISHDLKVVKFMCGSIAVMREGRIIESQPAKDLFLGPQDPYTKALLSSAFYDTMKS